MLKAVPAEASTFFLFDEQLISGVNHRIDRFTILHCQRVLQ